MRSYAVFKAFKPQVIAEYVKICIAQTRRPRLYELTYTDSVLGLSYPHSSLETLPDGLVATLATEDEVDDWQQAFGGEPFNSLDPSRRIKSCPWLAVLRRTWTLLLCVKAVAFGIRNPVDNQGQKMLPLGCAISDKEQWVQLDGPTMFNNGMGWATEGSYPVTQLLGI
ncbi:unannotated protein [freshwater metagenome]|uniref:Unannotated protein n=1 Tax=freshwater metagenome TaxID=449393 RepID=A0A6J6XV84_9ZZZZ